MTINSYRAIILATHEQKAEIEPFSILSSSGYNVVKTSVIETLPELSFETRPCLLIFDFEKPIESVFQSIEKSGLTSSSVKAPLVVLSDDYYASKKINGIDVIPIKKPESAQVFFDRMIPFARLGQMALKMEDAARESEKIIEEKTASYKASIEELISQNRQLAAINQQISTECSASSISNDLLPLFLKLSPEVIAITRISDGKVIDVNDAAERVTGYSKEEALETTTIRAKLWARPDDRLKMSAVLMKEGRIHNFETVFRKKSGVLFPVMLSAAVIVFDNDPCIITTFLDISERRRTENLLKARIQLSEAASTGIMNEVIKVAMNEAEKLTDSHISFFHLIDEDSSLILMQKWSESTLKVCSNFAQKRHYQIDEAGLWAECVRTGKPSIHNSYATHPEKKGLPSGHVPILRELVIPISNGEETVAVLGVGNKAWDYEEADANILIELSRMTYDFINRINAEKALKESEERLRAIFEHAAIGICQTDTKGNFITVNAKYAEITGYPKTALRGKAVADITHPDDREYNRIILEKIASGMVEAESYEKRYIHRSGKTVWVNVSVAGIRTFDAKPQYFIATVEDITSKKEAEQSLERERDFITAILDTSGALIIVLDIEGRVATFNRKCEEVSGFMFEELKGKIFWDYLLQTHEAEYFKTIFSNLKKNNPPMTYENFWRSKSGELRFISWTNTFITDEYGDVSYIIGSGIDITEKKAAEKALLESEARLRHLNEELERRVTERTLELEKARHNAENANKAKSSFLANMSHELRTPLNAILGFSQLMTHDTDLSEKQRRNLATINRSGEHLLQLINNVLDMAKIESGHTTINASFFDLHRLIEDISNMFKLPALGKNLGLSVTYAPNLPRYISADEGKVRQILINLLGNAIKFTSSGEIKFSVEGLSSQALASKSESSKEGCSGYLLFKVEDTGAGMTNDELEMLFKPFQQTSSGQNQAGGTGLGLSISRQFAQLMGGDLKAESPGHCLGATFTLEIPVIISEAETYESRTVSSTDVLGRLPSEKNHRILIAEDVEINRVLLQDLLAHWDFDVRSASNGKEALKICAEWDPDLIFMDMRMPVMDGYEAIEKIRTGSHYRQPVIVALTASTFEEQKLAILEKGADSFLSKPYRESEIANHLEKHLGVRFMYDASYDSIYDQPGETDMSSGVPDLSHMDRKWLNDLSKAASDADVTEILRLAELIKTDYPGIAASLESYSDNFDYEPIAKAVEMALRK